MTKTLIKKQMMEVFSWLYRNRKGEHRTDTLGIFVFLYVVLYLFMSGIFMMVAWIMCTSFVEIGMRWIYVATMSMMGLLVGSLGSVFNTYASLYLAKDNELLLSMPIPMRTILVGRLSGVFVTGFLYGSCVTIPTFIVYVIFGKAGIAGTLFCGMLIILIAVLTFVLSCILGWVVAMVNRRFQNLKIVTVLISLVFFGAYYWFINNSGEVMGYILEHPNQMADNIQGFLYLFYLAGRGAEGDLLAMVLFTVICLVAMDAVYQVIKHNFLKLATSKGGTKKTKYVAKQSVKRSAKQALVQKELRRFWGSSTYMLNCGFGLPIMVVAAVAALIKKQVLIELVQLGAENFGNVAVLIVALGICAICSMCDISAPSISLEGKNLWLMQSIPVEEYVILQAKRDAHILVTLVPAMVLTGCILSIMADTVVWIFVPVIVALYIYFSACFGLVLNLHYPNLDWTNENVPIKQSASVTIALFGSWAILLVGAGVSLTVAYFAGPVASLIVLTGALIGVDLWLSRWLKQKGSKMLRAL